MKFRTALYNVRGLGSAKHGTHHWWMQRVTSVALAPLMLWLAFSIASVASMSYLQAVAWVRTPSVTVLLLISLAVLFYHGALGLQVVVEDYVQDHALKVVSLVLLKFVTVLLALAAILAVLRVALSG